MNKYRNRREGGFDSRKERERYSQLQLMEYAGQIHGLRRQVRFELVPVQHRPGKSALRGVSYVADFTYYRDGQLIVEDVKSPATAREPAYIIKKKLMYWRYKIDIQEI